MIRNTRTTRAAALAAGVCLFVGALSTGAPASARPAAAAATVSTAKTSHLELQDTTSGFDTDCTKAVWKIKSDTKDVGTVASSTYKACSANGGQIAETFKQKGIWTLSATGSTSQGSTPGVLSGVDLTVSASSIGCVFTVAGTTPVVFSNGGRTLLLQGGSGLRISGQSGNCLGLATNGDGAAITATFSVSPALTVRATPAR